MKYIIFTVFVFILWPVIQPVKAQDVVEVHNEVKTSKNIHVGAERTDQYLPLLRGKNVAVIVNHTSLIKNTHLVDSLLTSGIKVSKVFTPEHGLRGDADAGEKINNGKDPKTGLPVISLYGDHKKPTGRDLKGIEIVVFDIQDVGVRFYTYISTLHYVMEACAENKIKLLILDRPNPNGFYIDGPVLERKYASFVGMDPVPLVYGMTVAEYARMLNGEKWMKNGVQCDLTYISVQGYTHKDFYELPVKPSPNLPNMAAVYLYPSLGLFEGTIVSVGRGTDMPFQVIGFPGFPKGMYTFTPKSMSGSSEPPYKDKECSGINLSEFGKIYLKNIKHIYLYWLKGFYESAPDKESFFNSYFNSLAGNATLKQQITDGMDEKEIRNSWKPELDKFKVIRKKYLLYPDFD